MTEDEISRLRHSLLKLKHEADTKSFKEGLPPLPALSQLADAEAAAYFTTVYGGR